MAIPGCPARNAGPQAEGPSQPQSLFSYVKNAEPEKARVDSGESGMQTFPRKSRAENSHRLCGTSSSRAGIALADPRLLKPGEVTERPGEISKLLKLAFSPLLPAVAAQAKAFGMQFGGLGVG